jgi:hypothetical protein
MKSLLNIKARQLKPSRPVAMRTLSIGSFFALFVFPLWVGAQILTPGTSNTVLDQVTAARTVGGYWRVQSGEDTQDSGLLHITGVSVLDNQVAFDGVYSPNGLVTCPVKGNWVFSTRNHYSSGGAVHFIDIVNQTRMNFSCPGRDIVVDLLLVSSTPPMFSGRAIIINPQGRPQQIVSMRIRRFSIPF